MKYKLSLCCFIFLLFSSVKAQTFDWAKGIGGTASDVATDVVSDASGNVYTVGYFYGTVDFDPSPAVQNLVAVGGRDIFISKMDANGNYVWAGRIGSALDDIGNGIALDPSGNILVTGGFFGGADFDPGPGTVTLGNATGMDVFVLKLSNNGTYTWAKSFGGNNDTQMGNKVTVDNAGNVYTTGTCIGVIDYDPGPGSVNLGVSPSTNTNYFVSKLNSNGDYVWAKTIGNSSNAAYGMDITVSPTNEVYTCGYFISTVDFDPGAGSTTFNASSGTAAFVNKFDANGLFLWVKTIGVETLGNEASLSLAHHNGKIFTTGYFTGTCDFDQSAAVQNISSLGGADVFVQALNSDGTLAWAKRLGGSAEDWGYGLTVDAAGDIYTTGFFTGTADFDPDAGNASLTATGLRDVYISKLSNTGNYLWGLSMGGSGIDTGNGIHVNGSGNVYTTGYYAASGDFDPTAGTSTLTNAGSNDIFVQKLGAQCLTPSAPINLTTSTSSICNGATTTLVASGFGSIGWYSASSGGTYLGGGSSYTTPNLTSTTTFYAQDSLCAPGARTAITVNVLPAINDLNISAASTSICNAGSTTISVANSQIGVNYVLRNDATNSVIAGPIEGTGSTLNFSTGILNATTTFNVLATIPSTNGAIDLDGVNDYIDAGTNNRGITSTMTISARVRTTPNGTSQFIASKYLSASLGYYLFINASGYASLQGRDVSGSLKSSGFSTTMVADNQWHEITGVVRSTGWEIWVDGVLQNSGSYTLGATGLATAAPLLLGQFGSVYTAMDIDRFAIWNTALTPALISLNATSCLFGNEANLTGYIPMSNAAGTIATDYSATGINGTLINMTVPACWISASSPLCSTDCQQEMSQLVTVTVTSSPAQPTITAGGATTFCAGGNVTLTSSVGTAYLWSNGETTQSINVTAAGTYTVQVGNAGCQSTASAGTTVTVNALPSTPTITAGSATTFCAGGSVTLTSSAGTSYLWSNGATTQSINATTAGTYTVQVTNASGCQSVASPGTSITVNALPAQPTITAGGPTTFCAGGSVTLTSSPGTSYLWTGGSMSSSINPSSSGTFTVQVTNAAGCQSIASDPVTVTVNSLPNAPIISPNGPTTFCSGGTVNLASSAGITYLWSNGSTAPAIDVTSGGTFTVQITGPNGCQSPASAPTTVIVNPTPTIASGTLSNPTSCTVADGSIQVTGTGTGDLAWSGAASGNMTGVTLPVTIPALNDGSYAITFTNAFGCTSNTLNATLTAPSAPAAPTVTAGGATTFCDGESVTLTASSGTTYQWSNGATTASIVVTTPGNYSVSITDASGCSSAASAATTVTVNALPVITSGTVSDPTSCITADGSIEVTGSGTGDLSWSGAASGNQTGATLPVTIPNLGQGNYTITFTDANGCTSTDLNVTLTAPGAPVAPTITANGPITFCEGGSVILSSSAGATYLWSNGETTSSITVDSDGTFTVSITDANGCTSPLSSSVTVVEEALPDMSVSMTNNVITATQSGASYQWINCADNTPIAGATTQSFTPTANGNYAVIITSGTCSDTSVCTAVTTIGIEEFALFNLQVVPNPGTDIVKVISGNEILQTEIYTMAGELVGTETQTTFSISELARGVYLLRVTTTNGTGTLRFVKE